MFFNPICPKKFYTAQVPTALIELVDYQTEKSLCFGIDLQVGREHVFFFTKSLDSHCLWQLCSANQVIICIKELSNNQIPPGQNGHGMRPGGKQQGCIRFFQMCSARVAIEWYVIAYLRALILYPKTYEISSNDIFK